MAAAFVALAVAACGSSDSSGGRDRPPRQCAGIERLRAGAAVSDFQLGSIKFLSPQRGIALSLPWRTCFERVAGGVDVSFRPARVWLVTTSDGGRDWSVVGRPLPLAATGAVANVEVAATSTADVWALGDGRVWQSTTLGQSWSRQPLPRPVVQLAVGRRQVWALACTPMPVDLCRTMLEHRSLAGAAWSRVALPRLKLGGIDQLALVGDGTVVLETEALRGKLLISRDGGSYWQVSPYPSPLGRHWPSCGDLATTGGRDWWMICPAARGMNHSANVLVRSTDGGRRWTTVTANANLSQPGPRGSIPAANPGALAAGSPRRLWFAYPTYMSESADGGVQWTRVPGVDTGDVASEAIDAVSPTTAWLLAPGAGLWRTTDGSRWHALGPILIS